MSILPGVIRGMPNADYHGAREWLGSTSIKTLAMRTPAHYQHDMKHPKTSDAFTFGSAVHSLALEGDTSLFEVVDAANWMTKAAKEAKAEALAAGKYPMLPKEYADVVACRDSIMAHPLASKALTGHIAEQSVFHVGDDGVQVKVRPDAYKPGLIVDLKTTVSADPNEFARTAYNFGYFISAAMYVDTWKAVTGEDVGFLFLLVEKTAPFLVSVVELDKEALDYGRSMVERGKRIYQECTASGEWPGYPNATVSLPKYATYQLEEILENE